MEKEEEKKRKRGGWTMNEQLILRLGCINIWFHQKKHWCKTMPMCALCEMELSNEWAHQPIRVAHFCPIRVFHDAWTKKKTSSLVPLLYNSNVKKEKGEYSSMRLCICVWCNIRSLDCIRQTPTNLTKYQWALEHNMEMVAQFYDR